MRLLVIEDDPLILDVVCVGLERAGFVIDSVSDGHSADLRLATENYDLVILDLGLPGLDGYEVLRKLRIRGKQVPVLVLTARDELEDRVRTLEAGADDYVVKPFKLPELVARINAISRRSWGRTGGDIEVGGLRLHISDRTVSAHGRSLVLLPREFGVLECLMLRHNRLVSKAQLQAHLRDADTEPSEGAIDIYIHRLRKKIEFADVELRTVRGFGYLLRSLHDEER